MADPMKIRAQMKGDTAEIRVLMSHAMETGQRKDNAGATVPAHFIQAITVDVGGKRVIQGQTSTSVSRNPVFGFKVKGAKVGDKVVIHWEDNKGDKRTDEAVIAA
ncbi:MAG: thiosulfate oxidation carrier complex protein SoxZ [Rhodocyclales bacterium]|nr:thiosulfate oxidation carrier complex protein SoxZ [Rhodocyclales bacterium]